VRKVEPRAEAAAGLTVAARDHAARLLQPREGPRMASPQALNTQPWKRPGDRLQRRQLDPSVGTCASAADAPAQLSDVVFNSRQSALNRVAVGADGLRQCWSRCLGKWIFGISSGPKIGDKAARCKAKGQFEGKV
jgi:hypothetical protein